MKIKNNSTTPSPTNDFIGSILETGDNKNPWLDLLNVLFSFNNLELILIILLRLIFFYKFITNQNINNNLLIKLKKIKVTKIESIDNNFHKFIIYNDKFLNILRTILILMLLKLLNLYGSNYFLMLMIMF